MFDEKEKAAAEKVYEAIAFFFKTRTSRVLAERLGVRLQDEEIQEYHHELFVRLAGNDGFMERVALASDQSEIVKLVCFYCRNYYFRNIIRDSRALKRRYFLVDPTTLADNTVSRSSLPQEVRMAVTLLPRQQRRTIELLLGGLTKMHVARQLGVGERTVYSLRQAALRNLRRILLDR